jgi:hypothetical protein
VVHERHLHAAEARPVARRALPRLPLRAADDRRRPALRRPRAHGAPPRAGDADEVQPQAPDPARPAKLQGIGAGGQDGVAAAAAVRSRHLDPALPVAPDADTKAHVRVPRRARPPKADDVEAAPRIDRRRRRPRLAARERALEVDRAWAGGVSGGRGDRESSDEQEKAAHDGQEHFDRDRVAACRPDASIVVAER